MVEAQQKMKQIYILHVGKSEIIIRCAWSIITKKITIQTVKKHSHYTATHIKSIPKYKINKNGSACEILKQHSAELHNDPERLSTEFLQNMIGVKCDE